MMSGRDRSRGDEMLNRDVSIITIQSAAGERVEVMVVVLFFLHLPLSFYKRHDGSSYMLVAAVVVMMYIYIKYES